MNVKDLIAELKHMPSYAQVYTASHDNAEYEVNGDVGSVTLLHQHDVRKDDGTDANIVPKNVHWVTLR